jgi:N-carbamoyl-L-amino-acid hydrolase
LTTKPIAINADRLNRTLEELGHIGETPQGMQRLAFSPADVAGREYTISLMRRAGLETRIDPAGNIIGRKAGADPGLPAIALGSHIDTVPNGGKYDGALGVMGAIEVVQTLTDHDLTLRHPVEALVFTNEEGTRIHRWLLGSRAMVGLLEPADLSVIDDEGVSLSARLSDIGGDLSRIEEARRPPGELAAYFELHIEQGPALHQSGTPVGVVTGITGRVVFSVEMKGIANHAGTTPMYARHDALVSASRLVLTVNRVAGELEICRVATVGNLLVQPNAVNVVPGRVSLGVEFRDERMQSLAAAEVELRRAAAEIAGDDGVDVSIHKLETTPAVPIPSRMQELVAEAATRCGLAYERLPSGAGHDAQAMAAITHPAMIFVPSINGVSHAPAEFSTPEDCANGANVLLNLLLLADERF